MSTTPTSPPSREPEYPPITLAECDAFEDHASNGAQVDVRGDGVEYSVIQPYDLVRFCHTIRSMQSKAVAHDAATAALVRANLGGLFDVFTGPADAIEQMALHCARIEDSLNERSPSAAIVSPVREREAASRDVRDILAPMLHDLTLEARDVERFARWDRNMGAENESRASMLEAGEKIIARVAELLAARAAVPVSSEDAPGDEELDALHDAISGLTTRLADATREQDRAYYAELIRDLSRLHDKLSSRSSSDATPTVSELLAWLRARPGSSWQATIIDIDEAVAALGSGRTSSGGTPAGETATHTKSDL